MPNFQINTDLRLGLFWMEKEPVHVVISLEVAPSLAESVGAWGPELGGYGQLRWISTIGPEASVGLRSGVVALAYTDCVGFIEYPSIQLQAGHSWSWDGPAWEMGGQLNMIIGSLEIAGTMPGSDVHTLRAQAGLNVPLIPSCIAGRPLRLAQPVYPEVGTLGAVAGSSQVWLRRGQEEHGAISAFLRLARELRQLGAPNYLVGRALHAAREEVGHACLCFKEVGVPVWVRPLPAQARRWPSRRVALQTLAIESWVDGVLGEGQAALEAEHDRDSATDDRIAHVAHQIAIEERDHARLAHEILVWCREEGAELPNKLPMA